jgi:hypothetical protein
MDMEMKEFFKGEIATLANILAEGFERIDTCFDKIDQHFEKTDNHIPLKEIQK